MPDSTTTKRYDIHDPWHWVSIAGVMSGVAVAYIAGSHGSVALLVFGCCLSLGGWLIAWTEKDATSAT